MLPACQCIGEPCYKGFRLIFCLTVTDWLEILHGFTEPIDSEAWQGKINCKFYGLNVCNIAFYVSVTDAAMGLQRVARIEAELELRLAAASSKQVGLQPIPTALAGVPFSLCSTTPGNAKTEVRSPVPVVQAFLLLYCLLTDGQFLGTLG